MRRRSAWIKEQADLACWTDAKRGQQARYPRGKTIEIGKRQESIWTAGFIEVDLGILHDIGALLSTSRVESAELGVHLSAHRLARVEDGTEV